MSTVQAGLERLRFEVTALKRLADPEPIAQVYQRIEEGSASFADYREVLGARVTQMAADFLVAAPAITSCEHQADFDGPFWWRALARVPDEDLPREVQAAIDAIFARAVSLPPEPVFLSPAEKRKLVARSALRRADAAVVCMALGDRRGLGLRRLLWRKGEDCWGWEDWIDEAQEQPAQQTPQAYEAFQALLAHCARRLATAEGDLASLAGKAHTFHDISRMSLVPVPPRVKSRQKPS